MKNTLLRGAIGVALVTVLGVTAFAQGNDRPRQRFGGPGGGTNEFGLLMRSDVQKDLALTDEQKKSVMDLMEKMRPQRVGPGGGGPGGGGGGNGQPPDPAQMREEMRKRREETRKQIATVLSADQMKRLDEISIQLRGARAILDPEVQEKLSLTDQQKKQIETLNDSQREANRTIMEKARNNEITMDQARESRQNNDKILETELAKVLTAEQTTKLKELGGKPFTPDPALERRGGGGGRPPRRP